MAALSDKLRIARNFERASVTVQIGGELVTLYAKPLTGHEIDKILARHPKFATNPTIASLVDIIVMKAEIESGDPAFDAGDKPALLMQDANLIHKINAGLFPAENTDLTDEAIDAEMGN